MTDIETMPVFLLHGLGSHTITLFPLATYLQYSGFTKVHTIPYPVDDHGTVQESVDYVDKEMEKHADKQNNKVIVVGQSMGGVVANNLHRNGWDIHRAVYIGSPLHGANLLNQLEAILPTSIRDSLYKKPYDILKSKEREVEPPHDYHTISMGWFNSEFDGCVYKEEAMLDPEKHTHLAWADHRTVFANPRLWWHVQTLLTE